MPALPVADLRASARVLVSLLDRNRALAALGARFGLPDTGRRPILPDMLIVHVSVRVKHEYVEAFTEATIENAQDSVKEPGIARFDVIQQMDDPTRFLLVEIYRTDDAPARHKETAHYQKWRDTVAMMMAEPRSSVKYTNLFPSDAEWL